MTDHPLMGAAGSPSGHMRGPLKSLFHSSESPIRKSLQKLPSESPMSKAGAVMMDFPRNINVAL
jgi:hypothetical protein